MGRGLQEVCMEPTFLYFVLPCDPTVYYQSNVNVSTLWCHEISLWRICLWFLVNFRSRFGQKRNPNFVIPSSSYEASGKKCKLKQEQLIVNVRSPVLLTDGHILHTKAAEPVLLITSPIVDLSLHGPLLTSTGGGARGYISWMAASSFSCLCYQYQQEMLLFFPHDTWASVLVMRV